MRKSYSEEDHAMTAKTSENSFLNKQIKNDNPLLLSWIHYRLFTMLDVG